MSALRSSRPDWEPVSELPCSCRSWTVRTGAESEECLSAVADGTTVVLEELSVMEMGNLRAWLSVCDADRSGSRKSYAGSVRKILAVQRGAGAGGMT